MKIKRFKRISTFLIVIHIPKRHLEEQKNTLTSKLILTLPFNFESLIDLEN